MSRNINWEFHRITVLGVILLLFPWIVFQPASRTMQRTITLIGLFAILAIALNIVFGHTDQLVLFVGGMAAIGGYSTMLLAEYLAVSPWLTMLVGATLAGLVGCLVAYVSARRGAGIIVIAILTLALQFIIIELINAYRGITGGDTGYRVSELTIEPLEALPGFNDQIVLFYMIAALLLGMMLLYHYIMHSRIGLAFEMIRQDQDAARAIGIDVLRYKVMAAGIATFAMGMTGPLFGQRAGFLTPTTFDFGHVDVVVLIILIVGGLRTLYGPLVGAIAIVFISEELRQAGEYRSVIFGTLLIVLFLYFRSGIVPGLREQDQKLGITRKYLPGTES